jgi:sugar phosphate isomerase/epimerase
MKMNSNSNNRRSFLKTSSAFALAAVVLPRYLHAQPAPVKKIGLQLYSIREAMLADPIAALTQLAKIGYKEIESAKSQKGNYYGLSAKEIKKVTTDLGMKLVSGHVQIDQDWQKSIDQAAEAGQKYLICSVLPGNGQTLENYQRSADIFQKSAEECKKSGLTFGYHNHENEFEKVGNQALYDILLDRTDPALVKMELDLGWVIATGSDPDYYFNKYPGRFPLWHLKDMDLKLKQSTEFGKGGIDIKKLLTSANKSGLQHIFIEQEEYTRPPLESVAFDYNYLLKLL